MKNSLISVIVPVYKVEKYINRCVESIINQTYENLEIILVDDGSPDNCPIICDKYQKKDTRIKVIHKANGGLSDARNVGIKESTGNYLLFVDSDDWLPTDAISFLYEVLIKSNSDISTGILKEVESDTDIGDNKASDVRTFNREKALEELMYLHNLSNSASGKIYKRDLFLHVNYPIGKHYEDLGTTYKLFDQAERVTVTNKVVYYYFKNTESIRHMKYSSKRLEGLEFSLKELNFIEDNHPKLLDAAIYRVFYECMLILNEMPLFHRDRSSIYKVLRKYIGNVLFNEKLLKKQKLLCYMSIFGQIGIKISFNIKKYIKLYKNEAAK